MKKILIILLIIGILFVGGCIEFKGKLTNYSVEDVVKNLNEFSSEETIKVEGVALIMNLDCCIDNIASRDMKYKIEVFRDSTVCFPNKGQLGYSCSYPPELDHCTASLPIALFEGKVIGEVEGDEIVRKFKVESFEFVDCA